MSSSFLLRPSFRFLGFLSVLLLVLGIPGCGGDGGGTEPEPDPTISISLSPTSLILGQGTPSAPPQGLNPPQKAPSSGSVAVTLIRGNGYAGSVAVSVDNLPTGVSVPALVIGSGSTTGALSFETTQQATAGTYSLTIRAAGSGVSDATATLSLTVEEPPPPGFSIAVDPASVTVDQGAGTTSTLTVTGTNGFSGSVALVATGQPAGMTVAFDPTPVSGVTSTVQIDVAAAVAVGTYPITITGSSPGLPDATTDLSVEVTAGGGGEIVSLMFCDQSGIPDWVAMRDGDGPWVPVTPELAVSGQPLAGMGGQRGPSQIRSYQFLVTQDYGSLAIVKEDGGTAEMEIFHAARSELGYQGDDHCTGAGRVKTATGTVAGVGPMDIASISLGGSAATVLGGSGVFDFTMEMVRDGPVDLIATLSTLVGGGGGFTLDPQKMIIRRNLNPTDPYAIPLLDFGVAPAFIPAEQPLTINNLGTHKAAVSVGYYTANGNSASFFSDYQPSSEANRMYVGVPAARQEVGDFHTLIVSSFDDSVNPPGDQRGAILAFEAAGPQTVTLGPSLAGPDIGKVNWAGPYVRFHARIPHQPEYDDYAWASFSQTDGRQNSAFIAATGSYLGGGDFDFRIPDFTGLDGWNNDWGLESGLAGLTDVTVSAVGWSGGGGIIGMPFTDGGLTLMASLSTAFLP